ncbi:MAG: site-2 protease family protein, partial [Candidatus Nanoperiomorbus sp.]
TLLYISGVISVSLAVMNLLPIPGLDGGRLYLTLWYRARHRKLTKEREEKIVGRGMAFLFGLIILITVVDLVKVFHK